MHIRKLLLREMKQFAQGHSTSKWQVVVGPKPCPCLHASPPPLRWLVIVEVAPGARARKQASPSTWRMWGERAEGAGGSRHLGQAGHGAAGCFLGTLGIKAFAGLTGEPPVPQQPLLPRRGCGPHITEPGPRFRSVPRTPRLACEPPQWSRAMGEGPA